MSQLPIKVRFPPSPTGYCHVGTARMAVLNYLFARSQGGTIVFRSEDTDRERSRSEFEQDIQSSLRWLGLSWDEFYRQSERTPLYRAALEQLISEDKAYYSDEPSKKDETVMVRVIRLRNPGTTITFTDIIRGNITFDTSELGDFVIARGIDDPLYHLAVVYDDATMGITHVIRGEEHISNTPRQILIQEALGFSRPQYAHYPLHLALDRSKLSKRKGDVSVISYKDKGYVPHALLNYIATLGWTSPSGREILSLDELVSEFKLTDVHKSGAVFDIEKLRWFNRSYLQLLSLEDFATYIQSALPEKLKNTPQTVGALLPIIRDKISVRDDLRLDVEAGEYAWSYEDPEFKSADVVWKGSTSTIALEHLTYTYGVFENIDEDNFTSEILKKVLWEYATEKGRGDVLWPLRYALTGLQKSPDPFIIASIIGQTATLRRISSAISQLSNASI